MNDRLYRKILPPLLLAAVALSPSSSNAQLTNVSNQTILNVRVGIHTYASDGALKGDELVRYQTLFRDVASIARDNYQRPIYIQAAAGSYADIYDWCKHDMIDFAVVTAGVYSMLRDNTDDQWTYLCTMGQGDQSNRFEYGIECVVPQDSRLNNMRDVIAEFEAGNLDIFMVSEYSTSGGIFPRAFLKQQGLDLGHDDITFTGSHANCLEQLVLSPHVNSPDAPMPRQPMAPEPRQAPQAPPEPMPAQQVAPDRPAPTRQRIAFVWDGAFIEGRDESKLPIKRLPLEGLADIKIPESAVIVRTSFYSQSPDFFNKLYQRDDFNRLDEFETKYARIHQWRQMYEGDQPRDEEASGWTKLFDHFVRHKTETGQPPRIALVLAGGGAKCAYQVGVAQVLEQKFREFRELRDLERRDCEVSLVVGTSGGAINALPVAMGTYNGPTGVKTINQVWSKLDARDILLPEMAVRVGVALTISLVYAMLILLCVRVRWRGERLFPHRRRARVAVIAFLAIGGIQLAWFGVSRLTGWKLPWEILLGNNYNMYIFWAIAASSTWLIGSLLVATGLVVWYFDQKRRANDSYLALSASQSREVIVWLTLASVLVGTPIVLTAASHFSNSHGIERAISQAAKSLINERLQARGQQKVTIDHLGELSETVLKPDAKLLEKDLIITATVLPEQNQTVESDIYFFAEASRGGQQAVEFEKNFDNRFIDLEAAGHRKMLFDAVLGSGAVFPFFPARTIKDCPKPGDNLHLVDGSFGHHIPIEAAVRWGATHILIVDPSPAEKNLYFAANRSLFENSQVALGHLFEQAQKVDKQAHQSVLSERRPPQLFTVNPEKTKHHISLLSFAKVPIEFAIDAATKSMSAEQDRFLRILNPPHFLPELNTLAVEEMD